MSMIITAKDNDKIKYTKSLLKSKNRNKESKFIIEGYRILTLAIECRAKLDYVFINEDFEKKQEHKEFLELLKKKDIKVYAFVGPSGTGKSYRAQMVAGEYDIKYIIDDGILVRNNDIVAGSSAKKAPTKIETVKHA